LTHDEKEAFVKDMNFSEVNLWLKDYYISRIQGSIREDLEGSVVISTEDLSNQSPDVKHFSHENKYEAWNVSASKHYGHATPPQSRAIGKTPDAHQHKAEPDSDQKNSREVNVLDVLRSSNNNYIRIIEAEKYYDKQNIAKAYEIIKSLIEDDMYFLNAIPLYTAILIELNLVGDLYIFSHNLVSSNPELAVSWFAVGTYYY